MEDREFLDHLHQVWSKTTGAEHTYWMPVEGEEDGLGSGYTVWAVDEKQDRTSLGFFDSEADADFITAVHGCLPDLVRRLHDALDESDRLDEEKDGLVVTLANRELEIDRLTNSKDERVSELESKLAAVHRVLDRREAELDAANARVQDLEGR